MSERMLWNANRFQFLVLTVPPALRAQFEGAGASRWSRCVRRMIRWLQSHVGFSWGYCRSHPCGDDGITFHPHANIVWVQREGFRGRLDVGRLRRAWAGILGAPQVDLYVHYVDTRKNLPAFYHHLHYIERPFPGWTWRGAWSRWYGSYPRDYPGRVWDRMPEICPKCGCEIVWSDPTPEEQAAIDRDLAAGRWPE